MGGIGGVTNYFRRKYTGAFGFGRNCFSCFFQLRLSVLPGGPPILKVSAEHAIFENDMETMAFSFSSIFKTSIQVSFLLKFLRNLDPTIPQFLNGLPCP